MRCSLLAAAGASPPRWLPFRSPGAAQHLCQAQWGCGEWRSRVTQGMASAGAAEMAGHLLSSDAAGAAAPSRHLHLPLSSAPRVCTGRCPHGGMGASAGSLSFLFFFLLLLHTAGLCCMPRAAGAAEHQSKNFQFAPFLSQGLVLALGGIEPAWERVQLLRARPPCASALIWQGMHRAGAELRLSPWFAVQQAGCKPRAELGFFPGACSHRVSPWLAAPGRA